METYPTKRKLYSAVYPLGKKATMRILKVVMLAVALIHFSLGCTKNTSLLQPATPKLMSPVTTQSTATVSPIDIGFSSPGIICNADLVESGLSNNGWSKIFEENFDTDFSQWDIITGGGTAINQNHELQYYHASNLKLINGALNIIVRKPATLVQGFDYTSGRIESKRYFSPDANTPMIRIYARVKLPAGYGMWPAFWSYGNSWPTNGEIDIVEARGQDHRKYQTNYFYGHTAGTSDVTPDAGIWFQSGVDLTSCYHVYYVEWTQTALKYYIDGVLVDTKTGGYISDLFTKSERITLNVAVGGDFFKYITPAFDPSLIRTGTMLVDWVKVFVR
jgi:beta-glucanase (GH16 family)